MIGNFRAGLFQSLEVTLRGFVNRHNTVAAMSRCGSRLVIGLGISLCVLAHASLAADPVPNPPRAKLRILFASSLIQTVNRNDVLAAFKLWIDTVGRNRGFQLETETESYDHLDEVEKRLRENTLDLLICTSMDYLQMDANGPLQPVFSPIRDQKTLFDDCVLVTRKDQKIKDLEALRGKSVAFYQHGANLARRWTEVMLGESGLGSLNDFFGLKSDVAKPSAVFLPVFFGKVDAAVINRSSLNTMTEMNPQLATQLSVLTNSAHMAQSVLCLRRDYANYREDVLAGLADLHKEPRGQQILMVFKIDRLLPFKPEYLDNVRDLKKRQELLAGASAKNASAAVMGKDPLK
jgi:phosphonate transport system substrate-binding protein